MVKKCLVIKKDGQISEKTPVFCISYPWKIAKKQVISIKKRSNMVVVRSNMVVYLTIKEAIGNKAYIWIVSIVKTFFL